MSNTHGWQPLEKPNQHSLFLLLNQLLSYSFRNTKLCCLPAMRKSKCGSETSACERMKELKLSGLPCVSREEEAGYQGWWEQSHFVDGQVLTRISPWQRVPALAILIFHLSQWQVLWIHSTVQLQAALNPCFCQGGTASWHTPTPWQWPDWSSLKASCIVHSCELGFSSKSCASWSHLFMSALLTLARQRKWRGFRKKSFFLGVHCSHQLQ